MNNSLAVVSIIRYVAYMRYYTEGELLKILREKLQKRGDQAAIADRLGFSRQFLNDVVHGRRPVTDELAHSMGYHPVPRRFTRKPLALDKRMVGAEERP